MIFAAVATIYLGIGWMIAHSRMEDFDGDSDTVPFHIGFVTAISLPLILLNKRSITGLIIGAAIGAALALATYLLLRRHRATQRRTTR